MTAVLHRILSAREERFFEIPPREIHRWPPASKRLPGSDSPTLVSCGEAIYMAVTLQRAMLDRRISLGTWDWMRITQRPHVELVRALRCASKSQTGALWLVTQGEKLKLQVWLRDWANYLEDHSTSEAWGPHARECGCWRCAAKDVTLGGRRAQKQWRTLDELLVAAQRETPTRPGCGGRSRRTRGGTEATGQQGNSTSTVGTIPEVEGTTVPPLPKARNFKFYVEATQVLGLTWVALEKIWRDSNGDLHRAVNGALNASAAAATQVDEEEKPAIQLPTDLRPVMLALKRGVDLSDRSLSQRDWTKCCSGLWRGTLQLPDVTPIYERTPSPISLDYAPPTSPPSFVLVRDLRDLRGQRAQWHGEGGKSEAGKGGNTPLRRIVTEDMIRPR